MRKAVLPVVWVVVALLLLPSLHADTFKNLKTGECVFGKLIATTERDGEKLLFVKLDGGETKFLSAGEWKARTCPSY